MGPQEALDFINAEKHTAYTLDVQYSGGEDQGAFRVTDGQGGPAAVFKLSKNPMWSKQIERAKAACAHLKGLGYPVPEFLVIGSTDRGTYWLETELPGVAAGETLTPPQAADLLRLIDLQAGKAISEMEGQDWSAYIMDVVFRGEGGHVRVMMQFGNEASALAAGIEGLVLGMEGTALSKSDLVHGDMGVRQVLISGDAVSGVIDWDQVGYGDRVMDLVGLWFSLVNQPEPRDAVMKHMLEVSTPQAVKVCAAHKLLTAVATEIHRPGGEAAPVMAGARTALGLLQQMPASPAAAPPAPAAPPPA